MSKIKRKYPEADPWAEATAHLKLCDANLASLIHKVGPCRLRPADDLLAALTESIISQQISSKAATTIFGKVSAVMSHPWQIEEMIRLDDEFLKSCGVSPQKRGYLASLVDHVHSGKLHLSKMQSLDDETVVSELTKVKGIGRWTTEMFLMFALNRPDILPTADLGIKSGLMRIFELDDHPSPEVSENLTHHWRPYRTVASWYVWRILD
jgi:3-methyladenine DNA glycosylase/8-oxoguanine DNA glycosylase